MVCDVWFTCEGKEAQSLSLRRMQWHIERNTNKFASLVSFLFLWVSRLPNVCVCACPVVCGWCAVCVCSKKADFVLPV